MELFCLRKEIGKTHELKFLNGIKHSYLTSLQSSPQSEKYLKSRAWPHLRTAVSMLWQEKPKLVPPELPGPTCTLDVEVQLWSCLTAATRNTTASVTKAPAALASCPSGQHSRAQRNLSGAEVQQTLSSDRLLLITLLRKSPGQL